MASQASWYQDQWQEWLDWWRSWAGRTCPSSRTWVLQRPNKASWDISTNWTFSHRPTWTPTRCTGLGLAKGLSQRAPAPVSQKSHEARKNAQLTPSPATDTPRSGGSAVEPHTFCGHQGGKPRDCEQDHRVPGLPVPPQRGGDAGGSCQPLRFGLVPCNSQLGHTGPGLAGAMSHQPKQEPAATRERARPSHGSRQGVAVRAGQCANVPSWQALGPANSCLLTSYPAQPPPVARP